MLCISLFIRGAFISETLVKCFMLLCPIPFFIKGVFLSETFYIIVVSCKEEYMSLFIYLSVYKSDTKNTTKEDLFYVYLLFVLKE